MTVYQVNDTTRFDRGPRSKRLEATPRETVRLRIVGLRDSQEIDVSRADFVEFAATVIEQWDCGLAATVRRGNACQPQERITA